MKKFLLLIFVLLFFTSCSVQENITSQENISKKVIYNIYGQKIISVTNQLDRGVYYIRIIENDEDAPYWTKKVVIEI